MWKSRSRGSARKEKIKCRALGNVLYVGHPHPIKGNFALNVVDVKSIIENLENLEENLKENETI